MYSKYCVKANNTAIPLSNVGCFVEAVKSLFCVWSPVHTEIASFLLIHGTSADGHWCYRYINSSLAVRRHRTHCPRPGVLDAVVVAQALNLCYYSARTCYHIQS